MNKQKLKKHKAFTLVEVIIYIFLFGIISLGLVDTSIRLSQQSQNTVLREQLILEGSLITEKISDAVRLGSTLNEALSSLDQNESHLVFTDTSGNLQEFSLNNGLLQQETNSGSPINLHSNDISVTKFYVSRINPGSQVIILQITLDFENYLGQTFSLSTSLNFSYE